MSTPASVRLLIVLRSVSPFLLAGFLIMCTMMPVGSVAAGYALPNVALMLVYYWSIHRSDLMTSWAAAGIGLVQDLWSGGPLGLNMLILLLTRRFMADQQRLFAIRPFGFGWAGLAVVATAAGALSWLIACMSATQLIAPTPVIVHTLVTIAAYPLLGWLFGRFQQLVVD